MSFRSHVCPLNSGAGVRLSVILAFARMKVLAKDADQVVTAVADSEVVRISDDNTRIKRRSPVRRIP